MRSSVKDMGTTYLRPRRYHGPPHRRMGQSAKDVDMNYPSSTNSLHHNAFYYCLLPTAYCPHALGEACKS
jgi:hypothetical protein